MVPTKKQVDDAYNWTKWADFMLNTGTTAHDLPNTAYSHAAPNVSKPPEREEPIITKLKQLLGNNHPVIVVIREDDGITEQTLKRLIRACHPDKHNNSDLSTEVTKWLLIQR